MVKILLVSDNKDIQTTIQTTLLDCEFIVSTDETNITDTMKVEAPEIVMLDSDINGADIKSVFRSIKNFEAIILLIIGKKTFPPEISASSHLFVPLPINKELLKASIISGLKARKSLIKLSKSNKELANSLYQLNVLYNTSSGLAGSLNGEKLISIMNDGIDKSLNAEISCTLSFKDKNTPCLQINSDCKLSSRLIEALKLRAVLNYKNSQINGTGIFSVDDIEIEQNVKDTLNEYDFEVLNYQKLCSYIIVDDKCFGFCEIFRNKEFSSDDLKCFQTLVNQVTLPLKSAMLYREITEKNKRLAKLERLKSEFISIVSHELKTPLTSIKNSLDILSSEKAGCVTEQMKKFFDMAKRNVSKLSKIINDLLDMSKIEAGKMDYVYKKTSILPVINDIKLNFLTLTKQKDLVLNVNLNGELKEVYADMDRIEQVLTNLTANAIKFSPPKGIININASVVDAEDIQADECFEPELKQLCGEYVQVSVTDEGIGIEKSNFRHVFDKFEQIENSLSREAGGSGLGLAIAKQLITAHNGAIWCDSILNKGATFHFVIPTASDRTRFLLSKKQLIQEAKLKNTDLITVTVKSKQACIENILNEADLWSEFERKDFYAEDIKPYKVLTIALFDNDGKTGKFLEDKINSLISLQKEKYQNCDIIYSYRVEEVSDEKNTYC